MLSQQENQLLTKVGAGTPMGELMRRYWHPIAAVAELDDQPTKQVRLMGEDLVLYRDRSGAHGLVDRHCPHRRADMSYGMLEEHGLRCNYHGWLFDETGRCLQQPFEDIAHPEARFKDKITIKAYPVEAKAGLLWAYLGPQPAPLVPDWEPFTWKNGFVQIVFGEIPCNWFQCQENSIDPVHFEWLHSNWPLTVNGSTGPYNPTHLRIGFDEFDYGFIYRRIREDTDENDGNWAVGRVCLWPNALFTGDHFEWRVPVDDNTTLSVTWAFDRVPNEQEPFTQDRIPYWYGPIQNPETGRWISSHIMNQDFVAWVGQGTVADRTLEHLGESDRGVIMVRRRFLSDMRVIEDGGEPKGLVRDPKRNHRIPLPIEHREKYVTGGQLSQARERIAQQALVPFLPEGYVFQQGQPEEVTRAFREAMGLGS